jgi:hypothetical protein
MRWSRRKELRLGRVPRKELSLGRGRRLSLRRLNVRLWSRQRYAPRQPCQNHLFLWGLRIRTLSPTLSCRPTVITAHRYSAKTTWPTYPNTNHDEIKD